MSGNNSRQDEETTEGDIDGIEGISEDEEGNAHCQLDHVVEHQVDEKDEARVQLEDLNSTTEHVVRLQYIAHLRLDSPYLSDSAIKVII